MRSIVSEEGYGEKLESVLERISAIESLGRTRELFWQVVALRGRCGQTSDLERTHHAGRKATGSSLCASNSSDSLDTPCPLGMHMQITCVWSIAVAAVAVCWSAVGLPRSMRSDQNRQIHRSFACTNLKAFKPLEPSPLTDAHRSGHLKVVARSPDALYVDRSHQRSADADPPTQRRSRRPRRLAMSHDPLRVAEPSVTVEDGLRTIILLLVCVAWYFRFSWASFWDQVTGLVDLVAVSGELKRAAAAIRGESEPDSDRLYAAALIMPVEGPSGTKVNALPNSKVYLPGLANAGSSNLCFLNAILQALASSPETCDYVRSVGLGSMDAPVSTALAALLAALNRPSTYPTVLNPVELARALLQSSKSGRALFNSEQQDAHELLLGLLEAVETESRPSRPIRGFAEPSEIRSTRGYDQMRRPFVSLLAHRTACASCGYCGPISHSPTEHLTLSVPLTSSATLEHCLADLFRLEVLHDYVCRGCSLRATRDRLLAEEAERLPANGAPAGASRTRKARARVRDEQVAQLSKAIKDPDRDLPTGLELSRVASPTTKQSLIARVCGHSGPCASVWC